MTNQRSKAPRADYAEQIHLLRECLTEIATNCEGVLAGKLPHFTREDIARAAAGRARDALEGRYR